MSSSKKRKHLVYGAGGVKAILAGTGAMLAFNVAGYTDFESIGGNSGGTVPAAFMASEKKPAEFLPDVIEMDFESFLVPRKSALRRIIALFRKYHYERTRPRHGAYATEPFRNFADQRIASYPDKLWIVAACEHGLVLFTKQGVFKYEKLAGGLSDTARLISPAPPSPGTAIGASCAVPGILDAVPYEGEYLVDGAMAGEGDTPIGIVPRHFGGTRDDVVAVDFGDNGEKHAWWLRLLFHIGCYGRCNTKFEGRHANEGDAGILISVNIKAFHGLQFALSRDLKWHAVIAGFVATADALAASDLIDQADKDKVQRFALELKAIEAASTDGSQLSCQVEQFLSEQGMYQAPQCACKQ